MAASRVVFALIVLCAPLSTAEERLRLHSDFSASQLRTGSQQESSTYKTHYPIPTNLTVGIDWRNVKPDQDVAVTLAWNFDETFPGFDTFNLTVIPEGSAQQPLSTKDKTCELNNLKYNTSYTFVVEAIFKIDGELVAKTNTNASLDLGVLRPPFGVKVAHLNYSRVLLRWNVDLPKGSNLAMSDLKFGVKYGAQGKPTKSSQVDGTLLELKDLEKSTNYTLTITTMLAGWRNASLTYNFKTRAEDWPAPVLREPKRLPLEEDPDHAYYECSFDFPSTKQLQESVFIICHEKCRNLTLSSVGRHMQLHFNFSTDYNVTVQTIYRLPLSQNVTKLSNVVKFTTPIGPPGRVDIQSIKQQLNKLLLRWEAPPNSRGPALTYEVGVWDVFNPALRSTKNFSATHAEIELPHLTNDTYAVTLTAIAKDGTTGEEFRGPKGKEIRRTLELLDPPAAVSIERTSFSIRIRVTPSSTLNGILYKAEHARSLIDFTELGIMIGFSPFEPIELNVSSCFLDGAALPRCGSPLTTQTRSNVDKPRAIENLSAQANSNRTITLSWVRPKVTNGPLDGYIIMTYEQKAPETTVRNLTATGMATTFEIAETTPSTVYNVAIAAYNVDLDTKGFVIGETSSISVRTPGGSDSIIPVVVLVMLVVVGFAAGGFYLYRKRILHSNSPLMSFSFINNRNNNA